MNPNMNNNININNINNNININHANLAEIISQQPKLNPKKISSITKKPKINNINNVIQTQQQIRQITYHPQKKIIIPQILIILIV